METQSIPPMDNMTNTPFIPQDRLDPRFLMTATNSRHLQGTMETQSIPPMDNMDMLRSMFRRQQEEGMRLRQQLARISSMERRGDFVLPPAKRPHVETEQCGLHDVASQADRLTQWEAQLQSLPQPPPKVRKRHVKSFPVKLMEAITDYYDETIFAWLPDGKSFAVMDPQAFCDKVLSQAFKGGKYVSFIRKLNRWGFDRLISGTGVDCFHHVLFQRNRMDLCALIQCRNLSSSDPTTSFDSAFLESMGKPSLEGIEKFFEYTNSKQVVAAKEAESRKKDGDN
jgi:hypothetical protein